MSEKPKFSAIVPEFENRFLSLLVRGLSPIESEYLNQSKGGFVIVHYLRIESGNVTNQIAAFEIE